MHRWAKPILILVLVIASVGCDQASKMIARSELDSTGSRSFLRGIVRLQYAENTGAFLSIGAQLPRTVRALFIVLLTIVVLAGFVALFAAAQRLNVPPILAFSFLLAGALGNMLDRIFNDGKVIDFLVVGYGPVRSGIFNIADLLIMGGVVLLLWTWIRQKERGSWGSP